MEDKAGAQERQRDPLQTNLQGMTRTWEQAKCRKGGRHTVEGNGDRRRKAKRGAETSNGG